MVDKYSPDPGHELGEVERLREVFEGTAFIRRDGAAEIRVRRHYDHRQVRMRIVHALEEIEAGQLSRDRILGCFGVNFHEVFHAKHSKLWILEADEALRAGDQGQLATDRELLEEPRMEAHGVRDFPPESKRGRFVRLALQSAMAQHMLPHFQRQLATASLSTGELSRDLAGTSMGPIDA